MSRRFLLALLCLVLLPACNSGAGGQAAPFEKTGESRTIHVVSNGWHTGIVVARALVPEGRIPEAEDFPEAQFLEFGWGDREYYPNPRPSLGAALAAGLVPTDSVVHLAGLGRPPQAGNGIEVIRLDVDAGGLARMIAAIDDAFDRGAARRADILTEGLHTQGKFYPAHGRFHLFNTCNTWVARKLRAAGVALSSGGVVTAGDLMGRLRDALAGDAEPAYP